jgi:hypothetical protein
MYKAEDMKLICLYHLRSDDDFKLFEKSKLMGNKYFHDFKQVDDNKGVYVFDLSSMSKDWHHFQDGKYSKLSDQIKTKIKNFTGVNDSSYAYIESFIHPEKYYEMYADLVGETVETLKMVGELCTAPDHEKESLKIQVKDLDLSTILP